MVNKASSDNAREGEASELERETLLRLLATPPDHRTKPGASLEKAWATAEGKKQSEHGELASARLSNLLGGHDHSLWVAGQPFES